MIDLVLTLIGPDKPGIVDTVAAAVAAHDGNWLDSRMAHLAGKFAGVLCVEVDDERADALEAALADLGSEELTVVVERSARPQTPTQSAMRIELLGLDRPGLLREVSALLATQGANVEELATDRTVAAHSGDRLFRADILVQVPDQLDVAVLRGALERIADDLMVEIRVDGSVPPR